MREVPNRLVISGGLNTSTKTLEGVAEEVIDAGFVSSDADVEIFRLDQTSNPYGIAEVAGDSLFAAHSLGHLVLKIINDLGYLPSGVMSFNPSRPATMPVLVTGGTKRFAHHADRSFFDPNARSHRQIVMDHSEAIRHPLGNFGRVPSARTSDSTHYLRQLIEAGVPVAGVVSTQDEFGPSYMRVPGFLQDKFAESPECHDGVLYVPRQEIARVSSLGILPQLESQS